MGVKIRSLDPNPSSAVARNETWEGRGAQASGDPYHSIVILAMNLGSQSSRAEEARESVEAEETSAWEVSVGPSVPANLQTINTHLRRSGSPGPSKKLLSTYKVSCPGCRKAMP